jgi:hypothetical protein
MSLRQKVGVVYGILLVGTPLAILLSLNPPSILPSLVWGAVVTVAIMVARCPKCGKSVFLKEDKGTELGFMMYGRLTAEQVCSRCGRTLFDEARTG